MPFPPKTEVPRRNKPSSSKLGISETFDPMNELEKSEPPKAELSKRELSKFAIERSEENNENDEDRDDPDIFVEK